MCGRLWNRIKSGAKKIGRFIGRVADKVSNVAGVLSGVPIIGGVASTVAKGANLVSKIGNGAANLIEKGEQIRQKYQPTIDKVKDAAQAVYKTGIPDKITRGGLTRVIDKGRGLRDRLERKYDQAAGHSDRIRAAIAKGRMVGTAQRPAHLPPPNPNLP